MKNREHDIILKLKEADPLAMKELYNDFYRPLCVYTYSIVRDFDKSEDIVQDVLISFWQNYKGKEFKGSLRMYLLRAAKNNSYKEFRKAQVFTLSEVESELENIVDFFECNDKEYMNEISKKIYSELDKLPEKCKQVFKLIVIGNKKYKEVAAILDISVNTVKYHYTSALSKLRSSLGSFIYIFLV